MWPCSDPLMAVATVAIAFTVVLGPRWFVTATHSENPDRITSLPNQPTTVNFHQYSGYVIVNEKKGRALFYYFVEAETKAAYKPLVLWFNGEANMLYVESPAGVGFSYSNNTAFYSNITDVVSAEDNFMFLQRWFQKFPQYKGRDLYIAGEAYAGGHYVPLLAQRIHNSNLKIKLKGIAIGNPLLDIQVDANALDQYWWSHGLISDAAFHLLNSVCNASRLVTEGITSSLSPHCIFVATNVSKELSPAIDYFDVVAGDACPSVNASEFADLDRNDPLRFTLFRDFLHGQSTREDRDPCVGEFVAKYLNRKDVQKALHAKVVGFSEWRRCRLRKEWKYDLRNRLVPTIDIVGALVKSKIRVLVYSGDQDSALPFTGTRTLVDSLAKSLDLYPTERYRAWFADKKVGGWTQAYGKFLSFAIVRGASQRTAQTQPKRSLLLFKSFLAGKPLPEA
ncbi:serine carboxypeptidase-like 45 isoform X3 [Cucurbita moschata]|uniref:Serine carboxypeptidase-like 45 isoform X3 n=1 Tax=Cucurbita moschata TaxID=3662 RepID=A0A6J1F139_CUCMO|nr:serine carboxypeptidase-like 45 isoform X3 [Cucurbita moschata]